MTLREYSAMDTSLPFIAHHGIFGMKWGVRRYQNKDGTLTEAGKKHYHPNYSDSQRKQDKALYGNRGVERINKRMHEGYSILGARHYEAARKQRNRIILAGAGIAAGTLVTVGGVMYANSPEFKNKVDSGVRAAGKYTARKISNAQTSYSNFEQRRQAAKNLRRWNVR